MLSSKLLPEMEMDDNSKREQLLQGQQSLPIASQIEKLKNNMIAAACESAEKVLAGTRKAYQFGTRQGLATFPTLDKGQAAKIPSKKIYCGMLLILEKLYEYLETRGKFRLLFQCI